MVQPIGRFQQQRQALMGASPALDPGLSQSIAAGIASLSQNSAMAQRAFGSLVQPPAQRSQAGIAQQIASLDPATGMQNMQPTTIQMPSPTDGRTVPTSPDMARVPAAISNMSNIKGGSFADLLAKTEGGGNYDTLFAHSQREGGRFAGVKPSQMTLGQLDQFDNQYGPWVKNELARQGHTPRIATPVGAGQIVGTTRRAAAKALGMGSNTVFNQDTQNKMINYLAMNRLRGAKSMDGAIAGLRAEWEGFKHVPRNQLVQVIREFGFNY